MLLHYYNYYGFLYFPILYFAYLLYYIFGFTIFSSLYTCTIYYTLLPFFTIWFTILLPPYCTLLAILWHLLNQDFIAFSYLPGTQLLLLVKNFHQLDLPLKPGIYICLQNFPMFSRYWVFVYVLFPWKACFSGAVQRLFVLGSATILSMKGPWK